jgi:ferritin
MQKQLIPEASLSIINEAIHAELSAFYLYKHLANQCQRLSLFGASKFFQQESDSELAHYQKHADFLNERGTVAQLPTLDGIEDGIGGLMDALKTALEAETNLSDSYTEWYSAVALSDPITGQHLLQFIEIQSASVGELTDWIQRLEIANDNIILIDQELGA